MALFSRPVPLGIHAVGGGALLEPFHLSGAEGLDALGGDAGIQVARLQHHAFEHDGACGDDDIRPDDRIVEHDELKKNDYNISPSRYIHTSDAETYRAIAEFVAVGAKAEETGEAVRNIPRDFSV